MAAVVEMGGYVANFLAVFVLFVFILSAVSNMDTTWVLSFALFTPS